MATSSPKRTWQVGRPRRRSSSSIAGRSSWISEYVWISSSAAANGSAHAGVAAQRARRREREHRPDPLPARHQRVAHRLLEPRGGGLAREAQRVEVGVDLGAQVLRVDGGRRRGHGLRIPARAARARSRARRVGGAHAPVQLGARLGGQPGALVHERGGALRASARPPRSSAAARSSRSTRSSSRGSGMARAILAHRAQRRTQDAVDEPRRLRARRTRLAVSTASTIAPSGGIGASPSTSSGCSISSSATRMIARSSGAIRSSVQPSAWRGDVRRRARPVVGGRVRQGAREAGGVALEHVVERAPGQLVLVEREDGGAALVGAAGHRPAPA